MAPLRSPFRNRGRNLLTQATNFRKTRDCPGSRGFFVNQDRRSGGHNERKENEKQSKEEAGSAAAAAAVGANPAPAAPFRAVQESEFERLKAEMLREKLKELWEPEFDTC